MNTVLFTIPLKLNVLAQYKIFIKQFEARANEYRDMLKRYDLHSVKIWHQLINQRDYALVYHKAGPSFNEKIQGWEASQHPFDVWFRESLMAIYDIQSPSDMAQAEILLDFKA